MLNIGVVVHGGGGGGWFPTIPLHAWPSDQVLFLHDNSDRVQESNASMDDIRPLILTLNDPHQHHNPDPLRVSTHSYDHPVAAFQPALVVGLPGLRVSERPTGTPRGGAAELATARSTCLPAHIAPKVVRRRPEPGTRRVGVVHDGVTRASLCIYTNPTSKRNR